MRPISPKANAFAQSMPVEDESSNLYPPAVSIPARLAARPRRMPRIDELPIPAQNEIRARGERFNSEPAERPMTLPLTSVDTTGKSQRRTLSLR